MCVEHGFNCLSPPCLHACVCMCVPVSMSVSVRPPGSTAYKWYKFDDSEVTEWKMDDDEVCVSLTVTSSVTPADTAHSCPHYSSTLSYGVHRS